MSKQLLSRNATHILSLAAAAVSVLSSAAQAQFKLTLLQNNDGESAVLPIVRDADPTAGVNNQSYGGAARFVATLNRERATAINPLVVSAGDNIIPGPQFRASTTSGTYYDAKLFDRIGYNALSLGNHDFDLGPDVLADVIGATTGSYPFLAANLDFTNEPRLQSLVNSGRIAPSTIVNYGSERVGVIGVVTETLPQISSPRNVQVLNARTSVQAQVDALEAQGVNKIVLMTQLQDIDNDFAFLGQVRGVDLVVSGGGQETQLDDQSQAIPGDVRTPGLSYPQVVNDSQGNGVPVFTTNGLYRYVGKLEVDFDSAGRVINTEGRPYRVSGNGADPEFVAPDAQTQSEIEAPVQAFVQQLQNNIIAQTQTPIIGRTSQVRTRETNGGNLVADAILDTAQELAGQFGVDSPMISIQNGGGIRNDLILGPNATPGGTANISEFDTDQLLPFVNLLAVIEDVPAATIKLALENGVGGPGAQGKFAQVSGLRFTYDPSLPVNGRVLDVVLADGTILVDDGVVVSGAPTIDVATIDFIARGGDFYPFAGLDFEVLGTTYQQALFNYLTTDLGGLITAAQYGDVGLDNPRLLESFRRIDAVPEPTSLMAIGLAGAALLRRRR